MTRSRSYSGKPEDMFFAVALISLMTLGFETSQLVPLCGF
jgi:hypothetical protein